MTETSCPFLQETPAKRSPKRETRPVITCLRPHRQTTPWDGVCLPTTTTLLFYANPILPPGGGICVCIYICMHARWRNDHDKMRFPLTPTPPTIGRERRETTPNTQAVCEPLTNQTPQMLKAEHPTPPPR
jgi:hypothetical protein